MLIEILAGCMGSQHYIVIANAPTTEQYPNVLSTSGALHRSRTEIESPDHNLVSWCYMKITWLGFIRPLCENLGGQTISVDYLMIDR